MQGISTATLLIVFIGTALMFAAIWMFVSWWLEQNRSRQARLQPTDSDPTLSLDALYGGNGQLNWWQRFHRGVADRLDRTELGLTPAEGLSIILLCGVILAAVFFFWRYEADETWMAIPAFVFGAAIPFGYFLLRQRAWRRRVQNQLPDTLFLMARSLRAGLSIDQAINVIGEHGVAPLSREFARMHRQLELGLALNQVLKLSADRLHLVDFSVFASVLSLHRTTGGNLPVIMDRLAHTTRDHNQLRGHYRAVTALGRWGNVIVFLMSAGLISYLGFFQRDLAVNYFESTMGIVLFCLGVTLLLGAMVLLYFLVRRDDL
jgi:tight adherence protein B